MGGTEMNKMSVLDYLQLRVLSCYEEAVMLKEGKMPAPRMAIIYPNYVCNHKCIGCDYTELNKTKKSYTEKEFIRVVNQLADIGVKGIEFCGGGEPTLHPYLPEIIDILVDNGISFGLLTNGTNLTPDLQERLVKHGSYCRISLESATEKIFNYHKRPLNKKAGFKNVLRNIENLVTLRNKYLPETKLQISIKYAVDRNNYQDVLKTLPLGNKLKVDSVQFKLLRNMPSELKDTKIINSLRKRIEDIKNKYPNLRIIPDFEKSKLKGKCWISPFQLVVDPYGDVYICCYYRHRAKDHCLGNMLKNKLKDIWYSQEHWAKLANIKKSDCNKYDCRFHYYNELMQKLVIDDIGQLSFI